MLRLRRSLRDHALHDDTYGFQSVRSDVRRVGTLMQVASVEAATWKLKVTATESP